MRGNKDSESEGLFWRNFELELLDDQDTASSMELHFRLFRLQLTEAADPLKRTTERMPTPRFRTANRILMGWHQRIEDDHQSKKIVNTSM